MEELAKGRGDHSHEKTQPWRPKSTEPPFCRPLRCSRLRLVVVVPSSRVRPSSIVTLSPSRGWWPAGQLESSSHWPQNWRGSWKAKDPKKFKAHPFPPSRKPACQEHGGGDANAMPATFPAGPCVEQRDGGTLVLGTFSAFGNACRNLGVCPLSRSGLGNEGLAAGLAAGSLQVSWCVSLSASRKAELHVNSWQRH